MSSQWSRSPGNRDKETNRARREDVLVAIVGRQRQLLRLEQLTSSGFSTSALSRRVASKRLFVVHRGVYCTHPPPYTRQQLRLAAVYACGPSSLVSHWEAAALLALTETLPSRVAITNRTGRGRRLGGVEVHRAEIDPRDRQGVHGTPCTSAARTIIDVSPTATHSQLEDLLLAADSLRLLNRPRLEELLRKRHGRPGTRRIIDLITDDPVETRSVNERRMLSICREFGVPAPLVNHRIDVEGRTFHADFCWPAHRLIVEADSWRWHGGRSAQESDSDRGQLLSMAGWHLVRFTRDQIKHRRGETGSRLIALTRSGAR